MSPRAIPDRWIPYAACGRIIEGTRIICFKVPLKPSVQTNVAEIKEIWDIKALLSAIPKLGIVIDLTNTTRYYDPQLLITAGVQHKKILMPGRIIPPQDLVTRFMNIVDDFLTKNSESLIGVHCTHGLNRTGYMVCRYMRDRLGISPDEAINRFETARGYQIERENYVADIRGKSAPPPDIGKGTIVKPITSRHVINYQDCNEKDDVIPTYKERIRNVIRKKNKDNEYKFKSERDTQRKYKTSEFSEEKRGSKSKSSYKYNYVHDY